MGEFYKITAKMNRTATAVAKYGHKKFIKGRTYTVLRKMSPNDINLLKRDAKEFGYKVLKVERS